MLDSNPGVQEVLREADALSAALSCLDGPLTDEARTLITAVRDGYPICDTASLLTFEAMSLLLSNRHRVAVQEPMHPKREVDWAFFDVIAMAWIAWAIGAQPEEPLVELRKMTLLVIETTEGTGGALHLMALHPWVAAVTALLENNLEEARRQYHRATEIGAQLGTETNPAIQWTYAATFTEVD